MMHAAPQTGPDFTYQQQGPGVPDQQPCFAFAVQGGAPQLEVSWFRRKDVITGLVKWGPVGMFLTFLATLVLTAFISIRASDGSPCGEWLCDISVYGGAPRGGPSEVLFRAGITILAMQGWPVLWARYCHTLSCLSCLSTIIIVMATVALMIMAYVPYYKSPVHFDAAVAAFALLGIGQLLDSCAANGACSCLNWVRRGMVVVYLTLFGIWFYFESFEGISYPLFEYFAALGPFFVFLTWSYEMFLPRALGPDGQAPEFLYVA